MTKTAPAANPMNLTQSITSQVGSLVGGFGEVETVGLGGIVVDVGQTEE